MPPLLAARHLGRRAADGRWLLDDVTLELGPGERLGLFGPSGSGKTLLLRALAALDPAERGEVLWRGAAIADGAVPDFRRRVIYLRQTPALFAGTVEDNLRLPFELRSHHHHRFAPERVAELLAAVGRDEAFLAARSGDLSGGEGQIVAFLRALQLDPEVLLLDEPTAALDPATAGAIERLVAAWHRAAPRRASLWVSHGAAQLDRVAGRRLRLHDGRLAGPATADDR